MIDGKSKLPDWFPNVNALWGALLSETLYRLGMRHAVVSPGSRSTPLTCALAAHPNLEVIPVLDERSAGFIALGIARRTGVPALLLCTSGTAAAHYYPALIEARESGVPMLIITADRPPELRNCASGQTIDQLKLFGTFPVFQAEMALPDRSPEMLRYLRQTLIHAFTKSLGPIPGPVHLNAPFRDPLAPDQVGEGIAIDLGALLPSADSALAILRNSAGASGTVPNEVAAFLARYGGKRGLLLVGPQTIRDVTGFIQGIDSLSHSIMGPILADGLGPLRSHVDQLKQPLITSYDLILRSSDLAEALRPEFVVQVGPLPTSKVLRGKLADWQLPTVVISETGDNLDPVHAHSQFVRWDVAASSASTKPVGVVGGEEDKSNAYMKAWMRADATATTKLIGALTERARAEGIFEGCVTRYLAEALPLGAIISVANSMPVRDVEYFWPPSNREHKMYYNRGANGIDGTLSTAIGLACTGELVWLLTGDLAFLHDSNGLLSAKQMKGRVVVILINNQGGGIFEHLPISRHEAVFEKYFATPQSVDFESLARAHSCGFTRATTLAELNSAVESAAKDSTSKMDIIEVITNRTADAAWRKTTFRAISEQLG